MSECEADQRSFEELRRMHETGEYTIIDLGELFSASRPTVHRTIKRAVDS